jgi:hypothetical protein
MDCPHLAELFMDGEVIDQQKYFAYANRDKEVTREVMAGAGYYQCYCKDYSSETALKYLSVEADELVFEAEESMEVKTGKLCYDY